MGSNFAANAPCKYLVRKNQLCGKIKEVIGVAPIDVYEVNSKNIDDVCLNRVFETIISPKPQGNIPKEIDWAKMEIEGK